jgi:hypothetical protein
MAQSPEACSSDCHWPAKLALLAIVCVTTIWPGDAPWINDEPKLFQWAIGFNQGRPAIAEFPGLHIPFTSAQIAQRGLRGTRGAVYGPFPVWIYQILLEITHDPIAIVVMRALLFSGATAAALYWLTRTLGVTPWLAVVAMLSPWLFFYSRHLWDNSFCIPLSAVAVAAYGDFLATGRGRSICLAIFAALLLPLTHLMSLALLLALAYHMILYARQKLKPFRWSILAIFAIVQLIAWRYWIVLHQTYEGGAESGRSIWQGFIYPLLGGHHLSATGLGDILGTDWFRATPAPFPMVIFAAQTVSHLAYLAVWVGMILAIPRAVRVFRRESASVVDHLAFIALVAWFCQTLLDGAQRVYEGPHYSNATWIVYAIFAFLAFDAMQRRFGEKLFARLALPVQAICLLIVGLGMVLKVHHDGGTRTWGYGTVMSQQISAVEQMQMVDDPNPELFAQWQQFPQEWQTLEKLLPPPELPLKPGHVIVAYRSEFAGDSRISVEYFPP